MSNLLFGLFLRSPLEITERKGHGKKEFPDPGTDLAGMDATVNEGWIDLKVTNNTSNTYQIRITFDDAHIYGFLRAARQPEFQYEIQSRGLKYLERKGHVYQTVIIYRQNIERETGVLRGERQLYENRCEIGYSLPPGVLAEKE